MAGRYYILCITERGDLALWWKPARCGYTTDLASAGLYMREDAERIFRIRGKDIPVPESEAEALSRRVVPLEDIPVKYRSPDAKV